MDSASNITDIQRLWFPTADWKQAFASTTSKLFIKVTVGNTKRMQFHNSTKKADR